MATEALKSDLITNATASTQTLNSPRNVGKVSFARGVVTAAAADAGSTYRMVRIPTNAVITSLVLRSDGGGAAGAVHVGLHEASNSATEIGAIVDADLFATAVTTSSPLTGTEILLESGTVTYASLNLPVWDLVSGVTADPQGEYEIVLTTSTGIDAACVLVLDVTYLAG